MMNFEIYDHPSDWVSIDYEKIEEETEKETCYKIEKRHYIWIRDSQIIKSDYYANYFVIPRWLAEEKELV